MLPVVFCDFVALSADEGTGNEFSLQHLALACFRSCPHYLFYWVGRMGIGLLVNFKELLYSAFAGEFGLLLILETSW